MGHLAAKTEKGSQEDIQRTALFAAAVRAAGAAKDTEVNMYDNIRLDRSLYNITGKSFTQALTELDPDEGYKNTELSGLDAFERQLKRFDIKVSGLDSDRVEKFFVSSQSAVLFPEYIRRMVKKGLERVCLAETVCGAVSKTDGMDYRGFSLTSSGACPTGQGEEMAVTEMALQTNSREMVKFAELLTCTYEAFRKQRLEAFGIVLRELGATVGRALNSYICETLIHGADDYTVEGESITYADLAKFWSNMDTHEMDMMLCSPELMATFWGSMTNNNMDVMICPPALMAEILALPEMKYCTGEGTASGRVSTPYGVTLIKCSQMPQGKLLGIDSSAAAELILGSDVVVDHDRLISKQIDQISCSVLAGMTKVMGDAVRVLSTSEE